MLSPVFVRGSTARRAARWLAVVLALAAIAPAPFAPAAQPNIVVISSDDMGYNELGFTSALTGQGTQFQTPNLDALAQQSVVARSGYSAHSLCSPSRAGLLLGRYQHRIGLQDNLGISTNDTQYGLPAGTKLMPHHFKDLGYTTGMIGKWHLGYLQGVNRPNDMGFDEFYGALGSGRGYFSDFFPAGTMRRNDAIVETTEYATGGDPSRYDPVNGRYATDAFGEEAADFINRHANDQNPFFLYVPFTATHEHLAAKQQDLALFSHLSSDPTKQLLAAMTFALDRAVGDVMTAINNNGIANDTIVVFTNDNGGNTWNDNRPFSGHKGLTYEGSLRVPLLLKIPGVSPGTYDAPIVSYDLLPTLYAAAGGNVANLKSDGVDLKPYLTGQASGDPHEALFWRNVIMFAVRKGDWKLGNLNGGAFQLHNLATDPGETNNLFNQLTEKVAELAYDFTVWEAQMGKPMAGGATAVNTFDHFVMRTDTNDVWGSPGRWYKAGTTETATLFQADGYANLILEFPVKNGGNYAAWNNRPRPSQFPLMLNQLRFTGNFTDGTARSNFLHGMGLLLVKNLDGQLPRIHLDATSSGTSARFTFSLSNEIQLLDDLEITGNGTQDFYVSGRITDLGPPRSVIKSGTSTVNLVGPSAFKGDLRVNQGHVRLSGGGSIQGANRIVVGSAGSFMQAGGSVAVETIDNSAGGSFQFTAGELRVVDFIGNLTNQGGNYSPGASPADSSIFGNFVQTAPSTKLTMELAGTSAGSNYDQLTVGGSATLGGTLQIDLLDGFLQQTGDIYTLMVAIGGINGTFANTILPALSGGRSWRLVYGANSLHLTIDPTGGWNGLAGDFNRNGKVDAADFIVWKENLNSTTRLMADGDGDGRVDMDDLQVWRSTFGSSAPAGGSSVASGVPEPSTFLLALVATLGAADELRRRTRATPTA